MPRGLRGGVGWVGKGTKAASMRKPCTLSDCCSLCTRDMNSCTPPSSPRRASMGRWVGSRGSSRLQMISRMSCRSSESGQSPTKDTTACKCHVHCAKRAKCTCAKVLIFKLHSPYGLHNLHEASLHQAAYMTASRRVTCLPLPRCWAAVGDCTCSLTEQLGMSLWWLAPDLGQSGRLTCCTPHG